MATRGDLRNALLDWLRWFNEFSNELVPRTDVPSLPDGLCLALTGVRRSGKTSTAVQIAKELNSIDSTFYFNFEDPVFLAGCDVTAIDALISLYEEERGRSPKLVILDEVHYVLGWERWVRKAVDIGRMHVIVTGSSSQLLSSEIATAISGRVVEHNIWPLSFGEYLAFHKKKPTTQGLYLRELDNFLRWGGFPKIALLKEEKDQILLLKQYVTDIVLRDVVSRHSIKNQHALQQLVAWYLTGVSCLHSYNSLRKAFGISIELASTLTSYLEQAFFLFEMNRYHPNLKVQARDSKKIYIIDSGLRTVSLLSDRQDWGRLAENAVYLELRRRNKKAFYSKGSGEVDFVLTELGKPTEVIQVAYSDLDDPLTKEREVASLLECLQAFKMKKGIVLTRAFEHTETIQKHQIKYIPLYQWLLAKE